MRNGKGEQTQKVCLQDDDASSAGSRGGAGGLCLQGAEAAFYPCSCCLAASGPRPFHECTMGSFIQQMPRKPIEHHHASMRVGRLRLHSN